jgi:hypothetical protein
MSGSICSPRAGGLLLDPFTNTNVETCQSSFADQYFHTKLNFICRLNLGIASSEDRLTWLQLIFLPVIALLILLIWICACTAVVQQCKNDCRRDRSEPVVPGDDFSNVVHQPDFESILVRKAYW